MNPVLKIKHKMDNKKGESIAEVLVSVLISSLGLLLLAGMVNASAREVLKNSKESMAAYWSSEVVLVDQEKPAFPEENVFPFKKSGSEENYNLADGQKPLTISFFVNASAAQPVVSYVCGSSDTLGSSETGD